MDRTIVAQRSLAMLLIVGLFHPTRDIQGQAAEAKAAAAATPAPVAHRFVIDVYHGEAVRAFEFQLADGTTSKLQPQPWVVPRGSQICIRVANAHPVFYEYSLGVLADTTTPADLKLPSLVDQLAGVFKGARESIKGNQEMMLVPDALPANSFGSPEWLSKYAIALNTLNDEMTEFKGISTRSISPEPFEVVSKGETRTKGFRWARELFLTADSKEGHLGSAGIEKFLTNLFEEAKKGALRDTTTVLKATRDKMNARGAVRRDTTDHLEATENYIRWTGLALNAFKAYGEAIRVQWTQLRDSYTTTAEAWTDCKTVDQYPVAVSLNIKIKKEGTVGRLTGQQLANIAVRPRYAWKRLEVVPTGTVVYTPGAVDFSVENGVVVSTSSTTRVRAGTALMMQFKSWGAEDDWGLAAIAGVDFLDTSKKTTGNLNFTIGGVLRLRDVIGIGVGAGLMQRDVALKPGVVELQPLPATFKSISDAVRTDYKLSLVFMLQLKGYKF